MKAQPANNNDGKTNVVHHHFMEIQVKQLQNSIILMSQQVFLKLCRRSECSALLSHDVLDQPAGHVPVKQQLLPLLLLSQISPVLQTSVLSRPCSARPSLRLLHTTAVSEFLLAS